jgi:hypothetical protein
MRASRRAASKYRLLYGRTVRYVIVLVAVLGATSFIAIVPGANAKKTPTGLVGTWSGTLQSSGEQLTLTVARREQKGTWKLSPTCYGTLSLESISNGYHHYNRIASPEASCTAGGVDCLWREGSRQVLDLYVPAEGAESSGLLARVR